MKKLLVIILALFMLASCAGLHKDTLEQDMEIAVDVGGSANSYTVNTTPSATADYLLGIDDFGGSWAVQRFNIANLMRPIVTEATEERVLTANEISGGIVLVSAAVEVRLPDCAAGTVGAIVMLVQADASEVFEIAMTDTNDIPFLNGVSLTANYEINSPGDAIEDNYIVMWCREANEWHSLGRSGVFVTGGTAD